METSWRKCISDNIQGVLGVRPIVLFLKERFFCWHVILCEVYGFYDGCDGSV
jgi:hypothetical protein